MKLGGAHDEPSSQGNRSDFGGGVTLAFVTPVSAVTFKNCANIDPSYAPTWHVVRNSTNYYAAQGEVVIRQLRGCTNADGSNNQDRHALAFPANMQGTNDYKQVGYGVITSNGTGMNFFATKYAGFTEEVSEMSLAFGPAIGTTFDSASTATRPVAPSTGGYELMICPMPAGTAGASSFKSIHPLARAGMASRIRASSHSSAPT